MAGILTYAWRWWEIGRLGMLLPPCFQIGSPQHHSFRESCSGSFVFEGKSITYSINETGIRDRPKGELRRGQILALGDSMIEGWGTNREEAIPAALEELIHNSSRLQVLNGGLRSTGTVMQSVRGTKLMELYAPSRVVWFLTENDVFDDRFSYAIATKKDGHGVPIEFSTQDFAGAEWVKRFEQMGEYLPFIYIMLRSFAYERSVHALMKAHADVEKVPTCAGIERLEREASDRKIAIMYVVLPLGPYNRGTEARKDTEGLFKCVPARRKILDIRHALGDRKELYYLNNTHLNPRGVQEAARLIVEHAESFFQLSSSAN